jgi:large subunit ribosomal protein L24
MSISTIRKDDTVIVSSGANSGKTGKVLLVDRAKGRALVEGLNLVKKTLKKSQDNPQGGIVEKEAPLSVSSLMHYCPTCKKGVRIGRKRDGKKSRRYCRTDGCEHVFDG